MTIIYLTEYKSRNYAVTFENKEWIKVQKFEDVSLDKNIIYMVNPLKMFFGKSKSCEMTIFSGAVDKSVFDGNTISHETAKENDKHRYVYIGGDMICTFLTNDKNYKYISNMGNNLSPCSIAVGCENIYFLTPHFKFIKSEKINDVDQLTEGNYSGNLFDYHSDKRSFEKLQIYKIHSNFD